MYPSHMLNARGTPATAIFRRACSSRGGQWTHTAHTHEGLSLSRYVLARLLASWPGGIGMSPWIGLWLCAPNGA
jgi:hypothetical protein